MKNRGLSVVSLNGFLWLPRKIFFWTDCRASRALIAALIIFVISWPMSDALSAPAKSLRELIEAAKTEGQLNLVAQANVWGGVEGVWMLEQAFNQKYKLGAKIRFAPGPNMPTMAARLVTEAKASQVASTDLYVGSESQAPLIASSVAEPYPLTQVFTHITPQMVELDNRVVVLISRFPGVSYNVKLVSKADVPKRTEVLNQMEKQNRLYTARSEFRQNSSDALGYEKIRDFLQEFTKQIGGLIQCGEMERLASGEFLMLAFDCGDYVTEQAKARGMPVESEILEDAPHMAHFYAAVPKNSARPESCNFVHRVSIEPRGTAVSVGQSKVCFTSCERYAFAEKKRRLLRSVTSNFMTLLPPIMRPGRNIQIVTVRSLWPYCKKK